MKLSRIFVSLLVAIGVVAVAAADDPLLRGERPHYKPRRNDFKQIKVFYDPKEESGKKCGLYYQIEGKEGILIYFDNDEIDESSDKVVCEKKQEATGGVKLPLNEDLDLDYAFWKGEVPRDADVRWRGDNLYVQIKKITEWEARYDPDGPKDKKCYLQYKYKTDETTKVYFRDDYVNESGDDKVVCKRKDFDDFPEGLSKVYKDLTDESEWEGQQVKESEIMWEDDDGDLVLTIEKEADDDDDDQEVDWRAYYNPKGDKDKKCFLKYRVDGGSEYTVRFSDDDIKEDGDTVYCERRRHPRGGLKLPVDEDIEDAEWKNEDVKYANVIWSKDDRKIRLKMEKEKDFEDVDEWKAYYNPDAKKDRKCWLQYTINDQTYKISYKDDDIEKDGNMVHCEKKENPKGNLSLPIEEDITDETEWKGEDVKYAKVTWKKDKTVRLSIEKEEDEDVEFRAYYNPDAELNKKCFLKYKIGGTEYTVRYRDRDIEEDGRKVHCERKQSPRGGLDIPLEEEITETAQWRGEEVKYANVIWKESKYVKLTIEREEDDIPQNVKWQAIYKPDGKEGEKCLIKYEISGNRYRVTFADDDITEDGDTVYCTRKKSPQGGLELPVDEEITDDTIWRGEDVKYASILWKENKSITLKIEKEKVDEPKDVKWRGYYNPKAGDGKKCVLKYVIDDDEYSVRFDDDDIAKDGDKVYCERKKRPEGGLQLPLEEDITSETEWKGEEVEYANVKWSKDSYKVKFTIEKEEDDEPPDIKWSGYYNPKGGEGKKCYLKYEIGDEDYKIEFADDDIEEDGNSVHCERNKSAQGGLQLPVEEDITDETEWKGEDVTSAKVTWKKNKTVKFSITKEDDGPADVEWKAFYYPDAAKDEKCYLQYIVGDKTYKYYFDDEDVNERVSGRRVVCLANNAGKPEGGIQLPVIKDIDAYWKGESVDDADMAWRRNGILRVSIESD